MDKSFSRFRRYLSCLQEAVKFEGFGAASPVVTYTVWQHGTRLPRVAEPAFRLPPQTHDPISGQACPRAVVGFHTCRVAKGICLLAESPTVPVSGGDLCLQRTQARALPPGVALTPARSEQSTAESVGHTDSDIGAALGVLTARALQRPVWSGSAFSGTRGSRLHMARPG